MIQQSMFIDCKSAEQDIQGIIARQREEECSSATQTEPNLYHTQCQILLF